MAKKILVVDDDAQVRKLLSRYLGDRGFSVVSTDSGSEALILVRESKPDLVMTDVEMPGLDGYAFCRLLKKNAPELPVIIMSGRAVEEKHVLTGFEGGADDYLIKPFSLPVVLARVQAVLRRGGGAAAAEVLKRCGIELDLSGRTAKAGGRPLKLTRKEFDLLAALLAKPRQLLSVPYLLETVWGYDVADYNDPGTVEVHISHLRKKLGPKAAKLIVSVAGHGYKFQPPAA